MSDQVGLTDLIELLRGARQSGEPIPAGLIERERRGGDPCRLAAALTLATFRSQDPHQSIAWVTEAIELFTAVDCDSVELEFAAFNMLGLFLDDVGRYDEAVAAFDAALARSEKDSYFLGISKAQHNLCFQALRKGELHEIVRRTWDMLSHESADPTLRSDVATTYAELLTCVGLYPEATLKHRLAVAESDRSGDMLNGLQARIRLSVSSLLAGDAAVGSRVAQELANWPIAGVERYSTSLHLIEVEWLIKQHNYDEAERKLAELSPAPSRTTGFEGLNELLTQARLHEATGAFEEAIAAAASLNVAAEAFSHDQARADEIIYRASKRLGRHDRAVEYGRRICHRLAAWCKSLDALPQFEATGELAITPQVAGLHRRRALLDRLATLAGDQCRVIAHEVRNALAPVTMATSLPGNGPTDPGRERLAAIIDHAVDKLDFVESRLDISAPVVADLSQVDVAGVVAEVTSSFARAAHAKSVDLVTTADPLVIETDRDIIDMALSNVISNAIKFTPPNSDVRVDLTAATASGCVISVSDHGSGFTPADMGNAFQPHAQLSARPTAGETSTGLGLYISQRMLSGIGGSISIDNRADGTTGAQVVLTLPLSPSAQPNVTVGPLGDEGPERLRAPTAEATRCLIVEDGPQIVEMVTTILNAAGIDAIVAASPEEVALVLANQGHLDVALIDIDLMSGTAGAEIAAMVSRHSPEARLVVTSSLSVTDPGWNESLSGLVFLPKPFDAESLLRAVAPDSLDDPSPPVRAARVEERFVELEAHAQELARSDPEAGADAYREALAFAGLYGHGSGVTRSLWQLSELSAQIGRFANQIDALIELASSELAEPIGRAQALQALGWAYLDRRATARARHMFTAAAELTPVDHELYETLAFGLALCDSGVAAAGATPEFERSPFGAAVERWVAEVDFAVATHAGATAADASDLATLPRAHLNHLAASGTSPAEQVLACAALDELADRLRQDVEDLFSVFDLFSERAALRNRRDLDAEFALLNDDLFDTLRRTNENTGLYIGRVRELLRQASELTDRQAIVAVLDQIGKAGLDYDQQARLLSRPRLHTPLPIVVAHLIRAAQRLAAERRVVMVWSPFAPGSSIDGAALGDLQAKLTQLITGVEPGSTVEIDLRIDPPELLAREIASPVDASA